ncbi:MAG: AsmA family protein, partial [Flavobacteriaceae bacterium]
IKALVLKSINEKVDATVAFTDVDVSLLKNFPNATVSIDELSVVNKIPFEGDTLFFSGNVNLKMSLRELFKGENEPMTVQSFSARDLRINIITNEQGQSNYDIAMNEEDEADSGSFSFELDKYEIENIKLSYTDLESKMSLTLDQIYHEGKGNLAADILDLDTKTSIKVTFIMDGVNYLNKVNMSLDAVLAMFKNIVISPLNIEA